MLPQPIIEWYDSAKNVRALKNGIRTEDYDKFTADLKALLQDIKEDVLFTAFKMCADDLTEDGPSYTVDPKNYPDTPIYIKVSGVHMKPGAYVKDGSQDLADIAFKNLPMPILTDICTSIFAAYREIKQYYRNLQACTLA